MDNEQKLNICRGCKHYFKDDSNATFAGSRNDENCDLENSLIRAFILSNCPIGKW